MFFVWYNGRMRLSLNGISVSFGENEVLKNIDFDVNTKDKIALVGRNGCGKTTLLKVITGEQDIDTVSGGERNQIQKTGKFEVGYLKQIAFEDENVLFEDEILKVYREILNLKARIEKLESDMLLGVFNKDAEKYEELLRTFDFLGGYVYQKEYNTAIKKFGFSEEDKRKPLKEFSGGQRTKIALIKLLLGKPDLLILDEPTNHLDLTSIEWLEEYLQSYNKAIIVVSHDRAFLDKFVNIVYEIERGKIKKYPGNYTAFAKTKALNYEKDLKEYEALKKEKERLQAVADRFRYKATKASMAQSKLKQIEKMGEIEKPEMADTKVFSSHTKPKVESGNDVLFAQDIEIGYDKPLAKISFRVFKGDKIAVVGGNGLGKSTLLKSIVNKIPLLRGKIKFGTNVEIGYFDQQTATNNISNETILDHFLKLFPEEDCESARTILGSFCFTKDDVFKNLRDLSGGEMVRLELCKLLKHRPNLLILDEPTNHMDIAGKVALENMLELYEGTIIFVSHDRYFVNKIAKSLIVFDGENSKFLKDTTYKEYEKMVRDPKTEEKPETKKQEKPTIIEEEKPKKENQYLLSKEKAKKDAKRKKIEREIAKLEEDIKQITANFEKPEICSDYIKLMELQKEIDTKNKQIETLTEEWFSLEE